MNKIKTSEIIEKIFKIISVVAVLFLMLNFIFNMGYFIPLGLKFFSLLEIRDYYEGTAPFLVVSILLYGAIFNIPIFSNIVSKLPKCINILFETIWNFPRSLKKLKIDLQKNNSTNDNGMELKKINDLDKKIKELKESNEFKDINKFFIALLILTILLPIFIIFINGSYISKCLLYLSFIVYLFIVGSFFIQNTSVKTFLLIISTIFFIIFLGLKQFVLDYNDLTVVGNFKNIKYYIIRPISKGYIIKDGNNNIKFINCNQTVVIDKKVNNKLINLLIQNKDKEKKANLYIKILGLLHSKNQIQNLINNKLENSSYIKEKKNIIKNLNEDVNVK